MTRNGGLENMDGARLQRKIGIITGAASGIGRATARRLAAEGAQLVLADIRPVDLALSDIRGGTEAAYCQADVSKSTDVEAMVSFAVGRFGALDFLVNNAGIPLIKTVLDTSEEEWDRVMAVNLKSIFLACRAAIPVLRGRDGATIVNVASELGRLQSLRWRERGGDWAWNPVPGRRPVRALRWVGLGQYPRRRVDGDAADVAADEFDLQPRMRLSDQ
jgi:NAD(P)-dependent dehydrogenase (short-subunit alcohol dehydrogenase family)